MKEVNGLKLYNMDEVAALLGICRVTAYKAVKAEKLRAVRIGHRLYASEEALRDYLNGKKNNH